MAAPNQIVVQSSNLIPRLPHNFSRSRTWLDTVDFYINNCANTVLTENQKFMSLYNALPADIASEESDLLTSNSNTKYTDLRTRLRTKFATPVRDKYAILTKAEPIGDRIPTQYLSYIKKGYATAGLNDNEAIKLAFAKGLPEKYAIFVQMADANNLDEVAKQLDGTWSLDSKPQINTISPTESLENKEINELKKKVQELSANVVQGAVRKNVLPNQHNSGSSQGENNRSGFNNQNPNSTSQYPRSNHFNQNRSNNNYSSNVNNNREPQYRFDYRQRQNDTCPEPPNYNNTYGLCSRHIRYGADTYKCIDRNCQWNNFKVPFHRCTLRECKWTRYFPKQTYSNFQRPSVYNEKQNYTGRKN